MAVKSEDYLPTDRPSAKRIRRLIELQNYRCAVTGLDLQPDVANLDHIVPISKGGAHQMGNLQVVHKAINQMKSTLTHEEFLTWCRRVVAYADSHSEEKRDGHR